MSDTRYCLEFSNRSVDESGFIDAYEGHVTEILTGLRPEHVPHLDREILRDMGSPDPESELAELVFRVRAECGRSVAKHQEHSVRQQLRNAEDRVTKAAEEFDELKKSHAEQQSSSETPKKPRRWFKALGQIGQGTALSIANVALAVGAIHFPVSPETQSWGAVASVATGIGTVLSGVGDLRNE